MVNNKQTNPTFVIDVESDLKELIPDFILNRKNEILILRTALQEDNFSLIKNLSHKIKGNSGGYGFFKMSEIGAKLESAATQNDKSQINILINSLEDYITSVQINYI